MPRNKPGSVDETEPKIEEVEVPSVRAVTGPCAAVIRQTIGNWVKFEQVESGRPDRTVMGLTSNDASTAEAQYKYLVVPFFNIKLKTDVETGVRKDVRLYWISASLAFDTPPGSGKTYLRHVSIFVCRGLASDPVKLPLLRVEWDCSRDYTRDKHAQPHWHVYSHFPHPVHPESVQQRFDQDNTVRNFGEPGTGLPVRASDDKDWVEGKKFHFALAAHWQEPPDEPNKRPNNEVLHVSKLCNWMGHCITYIEEQLRYAEGKL